MVDGPPPMRTSMPPAAARARVNRRHYRTINEAGTDVFDHIERFHNPRMQQRLDAEDQKFLALTQLSVKTGENPTDAQRPKSAARSASTGMNCWAQLPRTRNGQDP